MDDSAPPSPPSSDTAPTAAAPNPLMMPPPGGWIDLSEAPMHHRAVLLVGPITAFYVLALAAIAFRFWARHIKRATWRLSDYSVVTAAVFGTGYFVVCWLGEDLSPLSCSAAMLERFSRVFC